MYAELLLSLIIVVIGCELFTNGIEWVAYRYRISACATGSLFAAVGTAFPETILPIIAIFFAKEGGDEIGIGAILGAPFMLSSLAMFMGGLTIILATLGGRRKIKLNIDTTHIKLDLLYFMIAYTLIVLVSLFLHPFRDLLAFLLVVIYVVYAFKLLRVEGEIECSECGLYIGKISQSRNLDIIQTIVGLVLIWTGAKLFVDELSAVSHSIGIPLFILSFLLSPVATELPEKLNSVLWYWRGKDTLALGNITGAMIFQATFPVAIGMIFTQWNLGVVELISITLTLVSCLILYLYILIKKELCAYIMLVGGIIYLLYFLLVFL
ncbi:sodium:calcium antiporter [Methanosarcinales archaeon]|nr:MAG: sodium:calcium antiporter [Methanosarcinales archaeon]